jgi:PAS domain S-box-containing protein
MSKMDEHNKKDAIVNIADRLPCGIYRTSIDGKIIYANHALAEMLEYSLEEIFHVSFQDIYADNKERDLQIKRLTNNSKTSSSQEISLKTKSGKIIIVKDNLRTIKDKHDNKIYFEGIIEDVSEKKQAEEAFKESQARYKILTDLTIEGIIIHDNGRIKDTNASAQKMTGYSAEFLKGKNVFQFIHPDSKKLAKINLERQYSGLYELTLIHKNKSTFIAET